jgi:hypothetical protein
MRARTELRSIAGVNVNIANIPLPTEEERAEMRALDAKLDALAAKLKG